MMAIKLSLLVLFLNFALTWGNHETIDNERKLVETCTPIPSLVIPNRTEELRCCRRIQWNIYRRWSSQVAYLSNTLATMQAWNCPQLKTFCFNRALAFTKFTSSMYDRFCDQPRLLSQCGNTLRKTTNRSVDTKVAPSKALSVWKSLTTGLNSSVLSSTQLKDRCIQVGLYDSPAGGRNNYHEIIVYIVPYCQTEWCGFDQDTAEKGISAWDCLPSRCKFNVVFLILLFLVVAVVIMFANLTVIIVYGSEAKTRHSQTIFRISLAVADALVGILIFPSASALMYLIYFHTITFQQPLNVTGHVNDTFRNGSWVIREETISVEMVENQANSFDQHIPQRLVDVVGFFTTLSLTVSIYLLTASGIDRLLAITRPVEYRQQKAKRFAAACSAVTWALAIIVSAIPFFVDGLRYQITGYGFVTLLGKTSIILYIVGFFIPLAVTWSISIAMYVQSKKSLRRRASISKATRQHIRQQRMLNKVLSLMVAAFSLSLLPTVFILIIISVIPGTSSSKPLSYNSTLNSATLALEGTATFILLCNSLWNGLIYSIRNKSFRKNARSKYGKVWNLINPFRRFKILQKWRTMCTGKSYSPSHIVKRPDHLYSTSTRMPFSSSQGSKRQTTCTMALDKSCEGRCTMDEAVSVQSNA